MKNSFIGEHLELINYAAFKLPELNIFEPTEKTSDNFLKMSKADFSGIKFYSKNNFFKNNQNIFSMKNSIKRKDNSETNFGNYRLPGIYLATNNSIILETKDKIFLLNFEYAKITVLLNKTIGNEIKIINTYDENLTLSTTQKTFIRTYIFCLDKLKKLHFFYLEDNYINLKDKKIILHKMPYAGNEIIDMAIIYMNNQAGLGNYFFFAFLNKHGIKFFITEYYENDLALILHSLNFKKGKEKNDNLNKNISDNKNIININNDKNNDLTKIYESENNDKNNNYNENIASDKNLNEHRKTDLSNNINKEDDKSLKNRIKSFLGRRTNKIKLNSKSKDGIDYKNLEMVFDQEEEIKRIFANEENGFYFFSFLTDLNLYTVKFETNISPENLAEKFKFVNLVKGEDNIYVLNRISKIFGFNRNFTTEIFRNEAKDEDELDSILNNNILSKYEIPKKNEHQEENIKLIKFSDLIDYLKEEEYFYNIDIASLHFDADDIQLNILRNDFLIISHQKLYLINIEKKKENKRIYHYTLKNSFLIGILEYKHLDNNLYLFSNKNLFKFRIPSDFKRFENFFMKINEGKFPKAYRDQSEFDYKFISDLEKNVVNFTQNLNDFFKTKVESLNCAHCLRPGKIKCPKCLMENYCSKEHFKIERCKKHFFECNLIQFIKKLNEIDNIGLLKRINNMRDFSQEMQTTKITILASLIYQILSTVYDILESVFLGIEEKTSMQEYLVYVNLLTILIEKTGINYCFINQSYIFSSTIFDYSFKNLLNEYIYLFMNLKFLYVKFSCESGYFKLANYHMDLFRVHYLENLQKLEYANTANFFFNVFKDNKQLEKKKSGNDIDKALNSRIDITNNYITLFMNTKSKMLKFLCILKRTNDDSHIINYLEEISTFFENFIPDERLLAYLYLYVGFHLIKCKRFECASILFYKVIELAKSKKFFTLEYSTLYNLGLLNYSLHYYLEGIHNFECALRILKTNKLSSDFYLQIHETIALANMNILNYIHAYLNIKEAIVLYSFKNDLQSNLRINKLKVYLSYIIEVIQQLGTIFRQEDKRIENSINKRKTKDFDDECRKLFELINESGFDKKAHIFSLYSNEFLKLMQFFYSLTSEELKVFSDSNKIDLNLNLNNIKKEAEEDLALLGNTGTKNNTFSNSVISQKNIALNVLNNLGGFNNFNLNRDGSVSINNNNFKSNANNILNNKISSSISNVNFNNNTINNQNSANAAINNNNNNINSNYKQFVLFVQEIKRLRRMEIHYIWEMEVKKLYDCLPKPKQDVFKTLNLDLIRRHVLLKDVKDVVDHENLNYHPIHTISLINLLEDIKSNNKVGFMRSNLFKTDDNFRILHFEGIQNGEYHPIYTFSRYVNDEEIKKKLLIFDSLIRANFMKSLNNSDNNFTDKNTINDNILKFKEFNKIDNKHKNLTNSENDLLKITSLNSNLNKNNKKSFEFFYNQMIKVSEYKAIENFRELLLKIYNGLELQSYITYLIQYPETLKSFLYPDVSKTENRNLSLKNIKEKNIESKNTQVQKAFNHDLIIKSKEFDNNDKMLNTKSFIQFVNEKRVSSFYNNANVNEYGNKEDVENPYKEDRKSKRIRNKSQNLPEEEQPKSIRKSMQRTNSFIFLNDKINEISSKKRKSITQLIKESDKDSENNLLDHNSFSMKENSNNKENENEVNENPKSLKVKRSSSVIADIKSKFYSDKILTKILNENIKKENNQDSKVAWTSKDIYKLDILDN